MIWLLALVLFAASAAISVWLLPRPKSQTKVLKPASEPFTYHIDEPEFEFDPLAFWLFPDWDSGPPDEPFWMRPLKQPSPSFRIERNFDNRENYGGESVIPMIYGRPRIEATIVYTPGSVFDYMQTDEEWERDHKLPPAMLRPPKV
jgi:hypothetical protein